MKNKIKTIIFVILFILILVCSNNVYATSSQLKVVEYTDEYKEYMSLSDEEKKERLEPSRYNVIAPKTNTQYLKEMNNLFKSARLLKSNLQTSYDLRTIIPNNVKIRNQMQTNSCWAFATIGSLESNLGLLDYRLGNTNAEYDYSERHMDYAARKDAFINNETNEYGYSMTFEEGGTFFMAQSYLTNGLGAISEEEMPFENNENNIDISEIKDKNTVTTVYDTIMFEDVDDIGKTELMSKMKQTISNYGGIYAGMHGAQLLSDSYNKETGAIYCSDADKYPMNHAVVLIGWDDNYDKNNFNESSRPENNGAWIAKNSWGDIIEVTLLQAKAAVYTQFTEECNEQGWNSPYDVTNEFVLQKLGEEYGNTKVKIDGDNVVIEIGDKGYMYISYDDVHIYSELYAFEKSTDSKDYDKLYQNNKLLAGTLVATVSENPIYIANKFLRDSTNNNEELTMVSLFTVQEITCKVYVNPRSSDLGNLQEAKLEAGETITIQPGYHTIILAEPIKLTGDSFAVAISIDTSDIQKTFLIETKAVDENVEVNADESFFTTSEGFNVGQWSDLTEQEDEGAHGNVSIKAFTKDTSIKPVLDKIEITKAPTKVTYTEGENFNPTGMVVIATYSDMSTKEIKDYEIENGENLYYGQENVTISYTEGDITKTVEQKITVNEFIEESQILDKIEITKAPTKITYTEGENFNPNGMVVIATYSDMSTKEITDYEIKNGENLYYGQENVTISYTEGDITKTVEQKITVNELVVEKEVQSIEILKNPTKLTYIQNEEELNLDGGLIKIIYSDGSTEELNMNSQLITVTGFDNEKIGKQAITLEYKGFSATFEIEITKKIKPISSNLEEISVNVNEAKAYYYSKLNKEEYFDFKIKVENIKDIDENTQYTYYYSLSPNNYEDTEKDWIKIETTSLEQENGTYFITVNINTKEISNMDELLDAQDLYISLKEVASANDESVEQIRTKKINTENVDVQYYLDDELVGSMDDIIGNDNNDDNDDNDDNSNIIDNTISPKPIPQAGAISIGAFIIIIMLSLGAYFFIKHKNVDK